MAPSSTSLPVVTMAEVRARGLVVVEDEVFDLHSFEAQHKGGDFLAKLRGTDATFALQNAHGIRGQIPRRILPLRLRVGLVDPSSLPAEDVALRALSADFASRGLFTYQRRWLVVDVVRMIALFAIGLCLANVMPLAAYAVLTLAHLNVMWWVHDACHDSVFATRKAGERWSELASMLFVGTPVLDYQYRTHRIHHAFTNVIGGDHALETGPVIWDERMLSRSSAGFARHQVWAWFGLILPLTFPLFLGSAIYGRVKKKDFRKIALTVLRWALVIGLARAFGLPASFLVIPLFAAAYLLALISGLNHFHMPMSDRVVGSFTSSVSRVSQNMVSGGLVPARVLTWLVGGLDFHVEHHLFPSMPRPNYPRVAAEVRALFAAHGLAYNTCTPTQALVQLASKLRAPIEPRESSEVAS